MKAVPRIRQEKKGNDWIIELHDKLYTGILQDFLIRNVTYCPHLTVGRLTDRMEFDLAIDWLNGCQESFETVIDRVFIENIDEAEHAKAEFSIELDGGPAPGSGCRLIPDFTDSF